MAVQIQMRGMLLAIGGLSLVDLAVTLAYMTTLGMYEANPIARLLAATASPVVAIVLFKVLTVGMSLWLFHRLRRFASARAMALVMVAVLVCVTVQWVRYGRAANEFDWMIASAPVAASEPGWVRLD